MVLSAEWCHGVHRGQVSAAAEGASRLVPRGVSVMPQVSVCAKKAKNCACIASTLIIYEYPYLCQPCQQPPIFVPPQSLSHPSRWRATHRSKRLANAMARCFFPLLLHLSGVLAIPLDAAIQPGVLVRAQRKSSCAFLPSGFGPV